MNFPPVRFVCAGHGHAGESTILSDQPLEQFQPLGPDGPAFSIMDVRSAVPVDNLSPPSASDRAAFTQQIPWAPPQGFSTYLLDMPGHYTQSAMHRTASVDYIFILAGEIVLALDADEQVLLRAGDGVQIQGSDHRWLNNSSETCRLLCFSAAAKELPVDVRPEDSR